ncbi:hypothetical protein Emin_0239 [Elusimicrobium minutum Pei191]|uniref:Uncharacterized protein n=1 Tax=Elusimicrobium minutum (strain Pei191) TaxID=445932 RepID=B2KB42_ELUMP|nr:hypothetical protein [Elusimicrobium minutum]ACC97801.1 hypothetical protein Emin_0239 [Elusimicrobium minutum Pei191]
MKLFKSIIVFIGLWIIATVGLFFAGFYLFPSQYRCTIGKNGATLCLSVPNPELEIFAKTGWIFLFSFLLAFLLFVIIRMLFKSKKTK